jgi:hypothetical protein
MHPHNPAFVRALADSIARIRDAARDAHRPVATATG